MAQGLFDEVESNQPQDIELKVNDNFAKKYQAKKTREEANNLRNKLDGYSDENDSTSEEEDEEAELLTDDIENTFLKTLALIKAKDPSIYDSNKKFFKDTATDSMGDKDSSKSTKKPMYLKDYERERLLKKGALAFVSDDDDEEDEVKRGKKEINPMERRMSKNRKNLNNQSLILSTGLLTRVRKRKRTGFYSFAQKQRKNRKWRRRCRSSGKWITPRTRRWSSLFGENRPPLKKTDF